MSAKFPGRVWNGAGQYIMGADKEQLCMATGECVAESGSNSAYAGRSRTSWLAPSAPHACLPALCCPNSGHPAADFFLCPSRFEPCGLADIEFGWLGAVMIGHNTGGFLPLFCSSCMHCFALHAFSEHTQLCRGRPSVGSIDRPAISCTCRWAGQDARLLLHS